MTRLGVGIILFLTSISSLFSQKGWEAGGWGGVSYYFGDLNTNYDLSRPGPALGGLARYNFNGRLALAMGLSFGRITGSDSRSRNEFERARNLSFSSNVFDASLSFEFNFLNYEHGSRDFPFTPYVFGGFSVFSFNPRTRHEGQWVNLRDLGTEGQFLGDEYFLIQPALNFGLGFKIDLNVDWSVNINISARRLFTDYLDDVSTTYPNKDELLSLRGPLAVALSDRSTPENQERFRLGQPGVQRGTAGDTDSYAFIQIGFMYYFGYLACPKITPF
jgi:hypothetical protein